MSVAGLVDSSGGFDASAYTLVTANFFTIFIAVSESWSLSEVMFIYWFQSVVIGVFTVVRLLSLSESDFPEVEDGIKLQSKDGVRYADLDSSIWFLKVFMAGFFTVHYGLFHYGYYEFIAQSVDFTEKAIWLSCGLFLANHAFSYLYNRMNDQGKKMNFGELMVKPYYRIIPMHTTIVIGMFGYVILGILGFDAEKPVLVFFLALKTLADVLTHTRKHSINDMPASP